MLCISTADATALMVDFHDQCYIQSGNIARESVLRKPSLFHGSYHCVLTYIRGSLQTNEITADNMCLHEIKQP